MIKGAVELVTATHVSGWAVEDSMPDQPLQVRVLLDGEEIARATAELFRPDLKDAGLGPGRHGFRIAFAAPVSMEAREQIEVRATDPAGRFAPLPWLTLSKPLSFAGPSEDRDSYPVFILGSPRSGTSAMAAALRASTRYRGYDEGHLISLLPQLMATVAAHYRDSAQSLSSWTMLATVAQSHVEARLRAVFIEMARERFGTPYWIDKTPLNHMIAGAPLLAAMWPNARFIFMKRRAIENIASRMRKFSGSVFEKHCRDWSDAMQLWAKVRGGLDARAREVEQLTLAREPDKVAVALSPFLDLSPEEGAAFRKALALQRTEQTGARVDATIGLAQTGWPPAEQELFRRICGPAMRLYGYSEDPGYFG
ncbi:MAG TPA: sulfotransferase [Acetobacteraceae bacterium]